MIQIVSGATQIALIIAASSCGTPRNEAVNNDAIYQEAAMKPDSDAPGNASNAAPINERFRTLDDYLGWLRMTQGPIDGPWYEEVSPGVYKLRTGNLRVLGPEGDATPAPQTFTRAELEEKFGFAR